MTSISTTMDDQCTRLEEQASIITVEQLKAFYDEFQQYLLKQSTNKVDCMTAVNEIVNTLNTVPYEKLCDPVLLSHQLICMFRNIWIELVHRWHADDILNDRESANLTILPFFINYLTDSVPDVNRHLFQQLLIYQPMIDELTSCLDSIASSGKHLADAHVQCLSTMIDAFRLFQLGQENIQNNVLLQSLLMAVVKCTCSVHSLNLFTRVTSENPEEFTSAQTFLLVTCVEYIDWYRGSNRAQILHNVRQTLLPLFTTWIETQTAALFQAWRDPITTMLRSFSYLMFSFNVNEEESDHTQFRGDYCRLLDAYVIMLTKIADGTATVSDDNITLELVHSIYLLTLEPGSLVHIKSRQLTALLLKFTLSTTNNIVFDAYRCLAKIMSEQDIKMLTNAHTIATVFLRFFTDLIDSSFKLKLGNMLQSIQSLCQHDQVKSELINQGILPVLRRCIIESKFDPIRIKLPSLQILLSLAFDKATLVQLNQDTDLKNYLLLLGQSIQQEVQLAAENLLWKLEKENELTTNRIATRKSHKYDIMISYSHSDKTLCHRIHDRLNQDGYRVWIDRDQMHGATMVAMAEAIENSEFVLISMSDAYKQSAYCQSKAHYAYERKCHLIPLIMTSHYKPDGCLGIIASGKTYVDFPKLEFDLAYVKLKTEINQFRKLSTDSEQSSEITVEKPMDTVVKLVSSHAIT